MGLNIKVVRFIFENPLNGKVSVEATSLFFDTFEEMKQIDDEGILKKIRDMGINAIRLVQPWENVVGVKFGDTIE